jgi:hypothetical protein
MAGKPGPARGVRSRFQIRKEGGGLEKLVGDIPFIVPWYFLSYLWAFSMDFFCFWAVTTDPLTWLGVCSLHHDLTSFNTVLSSNW